ncbi:MAG: SIS domain-containing protein [Bacteroidota bacterium]
MPGKKVRAHLMTQALQESCQIHDALQKDDALQAQMLRIAQAMVEVFEKGNKVLFCGNGGSAADAQHLAAELAGRFYLDRSPLFAEALHVNSSFTTAVGNDFGFEKVFSRLVGSKGQAGDMLVALSTSGNSANVLAACEEAARIDMIRVGFSGFTGGKLKEAVDYWLGVPSHDTPRIQEGHILMGHIICQMVEDALFAESQDA